MNAPQRREAFRAIEIKDDDPAAEVTRALDAFKGAIDERLKALETKTSGGDKLGERLDRIEAKLNRPGGEGRDADEPKPEQKAFQTFVRRGKDHLLDDERKALTVANDQTGGYLAPSQFETEVQRELVAFSPIRQAARATSTSAGEVIFPKRTGRLTAKWVGETETRSASESTYGQAEIPVHEIAVYVDVSNRLLEDAAVDIEAELAFDFAEEFGLKEGEAFVKGDGVKKPLGIMSDPDVEAVPNGHATNLSPDALITLMYALPQAYRSRGSWLMNGATIARVRLLKDGQGNFLWQPSYQVGQPETLLGRPLIEAPDMDGIAANACPIAYGDIGAGYRILDRIGLSVLRDPYTQQTNGLTRFHARRRVGAGVVRPDAIRKLKMVAG